MKEDIKLVLVDIDGTLLNSKLEVTEKTIAAIAKLKEHHILFGIATGRTPYAVERMIEGWGIQQYVDLIMGFNGGATLYLDTKECVTCKPIEGKYLKEVRDISKDFDVNYMIYDGLTVHTCIDEPMVRMIADHNELPCIIDGLVPYNNRTVEKMLMVGKKEIIDEAEVFFNNLHPTNYRAVRSTPVLLEFLNPELSKSVGIQGICDRKNMTKENVLTFGDEINDFEMIRDCVGVAMGNARKEIKDVARYITLSNDEDGIGVFLEKEVLCS